MIKTLKFTKDPDNRWYVVLPEWEGDRARLEMVAGADTMLDVLAQGEAETSLQMSDEKLDTGFQLDFVEECCDGATYMIANHPNDLEFAVWLCDVTVFVFGGFPKVIFINS